MNLDRAHRCQRGRQSYRGDVALTVNCFLHTSIDVVYALYIRIAPGRRRRSTELIACFQHIFLSPVTEGNAGGRQPV